MTESAEHVADVYIAQQDGNQQGLSLDSCTGPPGLRVGLSATSAALASLAYFSSLSKSFTHAWSVPMGSTGAACSVTCCQYV